MLLQLAAHPLGRSFLSLEKRYCAAEKGEYRWKTGGASNIEELTVQLHGVMLRRSKDNVLALPPKLRHGCRSKYRRAPARVRSRRSLSCLRERTRGPWPRETRRIGPAASCWRS